MKLFYKIYLFMLILLACILTFSGYIEYLREVRIFNHDMEQDALLLGRSLSGLTEHALKKSGVDIARKLIGQANASEKNVSIRLIHLAAQDKNVAPKVPLERLQPLYEGKSKSVVVKTDDMGLQRITYVPVGTVEKHSPWALELSESTSVVKSYTRHSIVYLLIIMAAIFLASGILLWHHFYRWIHKPLVRFIEKSGRIGKGDLAPDLVVEGSDEFAELAETLNTMCRELNASWEALVVETQNRIEAIEQLRHSERLATLGRLSAGMAHELGTPLNVISGRAKMIYAGELADHEITECAQIIREQAQRITKITQDLLDFSRRRKPNQSRQDIGALVSQVLDILTSSAQKVKVEFDFINHAAKESVSVDAAQIQQVIINLVMNGIQSMENGGRLTIELMTGNKPFDDEEHAMQKYIAIHVRDEGCGIPADVREHIFEPFFTTKDVGSGTGLGLSISYGIVAEHGGWIEVESEPGKGTCFIVYLPREVTE